jgi:hypothetical protein
MGWSEKDICKIHGRPYKEPTRRFSLYSRTGQIIGSIEQSIFVPYANGSRTRPDGFRIGSRVFVWSSKHEQYREATLEIIEDDDPMIRMLLEISGK